VIDIGAFEFDPSSNVPKEIPNLGYRLEQNFPNPFNPATRIAYRTGHAGRVRLRVIDALGREVAMPVDEVRAAGDHTTILDASQLVTGVYFYELRAGEFRSVRRLVVLR
jgi:hypothetical protein